LSSPSGDPKQQTRPVTSAGQTGMLNVPCGRPRTHRGPVEYKVVALRECPLPETLLECDTPQKVAEYWHLHVATSPLFNPELETLVVLHLNTRNRVRGHHVVATGTLDSVVSHSREVFRTAIVAASAAIVLVHNHPSGETQPSEADLVVTRELVRAGRLLRIEVRDHIIIGANRYASLKELGLFSF